ncbi:Multidrug resistance-associated protein 4 [Bulinus truncatus]|nr:Multidrug resistance-associated protein 4 [Bulinus truncatus]
MVDHTSRSCPYDHANIISKVTFWWMNALFKLGFKNQLSSLNVCDVSKEDESSFLESKLESYWKEEVQKYTEGGRASLFRAVFWAFKWQWILPGILIFLSEAIKLLQPFLIGLLVSYFNDEEGSVNISTAYGIGTALGLSALLQIFINPTYFFIMQHLALRMKVAVGALIYRKSIDLLHYFWISPLSIIIVMYLMYRQIGVNCFWGLAVVAVIVPIQAGLSSAFGKLRSEMSLLRLSVLLQSVESAIDILSARMALLAVVIVLWYKGTNRAVDVFTTVAWLSVLQSAASKFPVQVLQGLGNLQSSAELVQKFLLLDEEKEQIKDLHLHRSVVYRNEPRTDWAIDIDHMTARWPLVYTEGKRRFNKRRERTSTSSTKSLLHESDVDHAFSLKYISLQVKKGELLAVVGVVGSGKSSLIMALIGELPYEIGQIAINGRVSYCGQNNWVFSGTVRDNILFGHSFNASHYQQVIQACGLVHDLDLLPKGDQTYVGERGLQLSGGQKARLALARAVYHDADIFLLDDPLSAVDINVGRHIFQSCILNLLKDKTVVLVTHQLQYLKKVDRIVVLRDGSVHDVGTYDELKSRGMDMKALTLGDHPKHATEAALEAEEEEKQLLLECKLLKSSDNEIEDKDETITDAVGFSVYWQYFSAGFGPVLLPLLLPLWFAGPALFCLSDWMLTDWVNSQDQKLPDNVTSPAESHEWDNLPTNLQIYIIALISSAVAYMLYATIFLQMAATAGEILNRFSRDLGFIDDSVSTLGYFVSMKTTQFLGFFLVTVIVNPWLTFAFVPLMLVIILIRFYALRTLRQVKRLEAKARSPVYSHVSDTVLGLECIRALGKKDQFLTEFNEHQNSHTSAWFLYLSSYRWMSVRSLGAVVVYMNIIIFVSLALKDSLNGNLLALSLIYCIAIGEPFEWYMRVSADLETQMTSVERVLNYCDLEQEPPKISDKPPSPDWPVIGAVTFTNLSLKYSPEAPFVLKKIDCHIKGKEKVGIVGRTGLGKSSLISALFRLAQPKGTIYIDSVDIGKLGLYELRSKISVIPQDPILFSQTLRWNLDPLEEYSDERLWHALEQVQLKRKVEQMPGMLDADIQENGANLSVGQRQLICLARAILKHNRILILDEATANVDQETDNIIQRTVRARFRDSTVLIIAHRLYTVMDCDRIMVLENGELVEFDSPYNLLKNNDGIFARMVLNLGKSQAKQLQALAELSQHQRASASLQLQRAMLLANEQLAQSTEDLSAGRAALSWNRFTHSQDSLDKAQIESIVEKEKKSVGPSQRIIRRRSPGRNKKGISEEEELLSYDTPPKAHQAFTHSQTQNGSNSGTESPHTQVKKNALAESSSEEKKVDKGSGLDSRPVNLISKKDSGREHVFESDVDYEPKRRSSGASSNKKQHSLEKGSAQDRSASVTRVQSDGSASKTWVPTSGSPSVSRTPSGGSASVSRTPSGGSASVTRTPSGGSASVTRTPSGGSASVTRTPSGGSASVTRVPSGGSASISKVPTGGLPSVTRVPSDSPSDRSPSGTRIPSSGSPHSQNTKKSTQSIELVTQRNIVKEEFV